MSGSLAVLLAVLSMSAQHYDGFGGDNATYYAFPKFWTNTGFCPAGELTHEAIKEFLLSDAMQMNLLQLSALPKGALTHIRIHWLLELIQFVQFTQSGFPIFDFSDLDDFLTDLDTMNFYPVIEFMGNLSDVFTKNPTFNLWEDFSYQVTNRYLNMFGAKRVLNWRFETWNEPDLLVYNKLNFTLEDYIIYTKSAKHGVERAGTRPMHSLHLSVKGPAGLFKARSHHPLCWGVLEYCNDNITQCPFDILTYHRKGNGSNAASEIVNESKILLSKIYGMYPELRQLPISNDEADPISGWSTPRDFHEDVHYAITLVNIVLEHWSAKLNSNEFANLETISHDNAFLSYHPHEFSQRTLLAHFRMNNSDPPHSQFIQKPVYAALGLLSRLADMASDIQEIKTSYGFNLNVLKTTAIKGQPTYLSWLIVPVNELKCDRNTCPDIINLPNLHLCDKEVFAFIIEIIDQEQTNPVKVWREFNSQPFPNATVREAMRRHQLLKIHTMGVLKAPKIDVNYGNLSYPWLMQLRVCSNLNGHLIQPQKLQITGVTHNEVLVTWEEINTVSSHCLKTYEVWFRTNNTLEWLHISFGWHLSYPLFQYTPVNGTRVNVLHDKIARQTEHFLHMSRITRELAKTENQIAKKIALYYSLRGKYKFETQDFTKYAALMFLTERVHFQYKHNT